MLLLSTFPHGRYVRARMHRLAFPHPLPLLTCGVLLAAALSHVLPAGRYDRKDDPATGRSVVVAGTYHAVPRTPVGFFQTLVAIPKGLIDAASGIFFVFLVGGAFTVVDQTGALRQAVGALVRRLGTNDRVVIPVVSLLFAAGGALENMQEEIIALVPVLLLRGRRCGVQSDRPVPGGDRAEARRTSAPLRRGVPRGVPRDCARRLDLRHE